MPQTENCSSCKTNGSPASTSASDPFGKVSHKLVVLSGKGGVGKSTVSVNLAYALSALGLRVGLLDVDIHGPSVPFMLGLENERCVCKDDLLLPVEVDGIKVMSVGFFFAQQEEALIWRGPRKTALIQQFVHGTDWGELDYLVIDSPPGTGDEPLSVCQAVSDIDGAVIVTTPQRVAVNDVKRSVTFCERLQLPVLGVVENMSGFVCPKCGEVTQILPPGGGQAIAASMGIPFLGAIPMTPDLALAADNGKVYVNNQTDSPSAITLMEIARSIAQRAKRDTQIEQKQRGEAHENCNTIG